MDHCQAQCAPASLFSLELADFIRGKMNASHRISTVKGSAGLVSSNHDISDTTHGDIGEVEEFERR